MPRLRVKLPLVDRISSLSLPGRHHETQASVELAIPAEVRPLEHHLLPLEQSALLGIR